MTLVPAYGRDYKSRAAVLADFVAGKDFLICDMSHPSDGKPINRAQLVDDGVKKVSVRYQGLRNLTIIDVR